MKDKMNKTIHRLDILMSAIISVLLTFAVLIGLDDNGIYVFKSVHRFPVADTTAIIKRAVVNVELDRDSQLQDGYQTIADLYDTITVLSHNNDSLRKEAKRCLIDTVFIFVVPDCKN